MWDNYHKDRIREPFLNVAGAAMHRILIADDDAAIRRLLRSVLEDEGYEVAEVGTGAEILAAYASPNPPDLVLADVRMPDQSGIDVLRARSKAKTADGFQPLIVMTAYGSSSLAIEAMQLGAYDYLTKPFDMHDVVVTVQRFFERQALSEQVKVLSTRLGEKDPNELIIGESPVMHEVYKTIGRVARSDATVLITGESGTGKELIATVLHRNSSYRSGQLVKVNCAALPESLLESELFGHEKGAFTGAIAQRKGRFELANKGTIFLDEIGEMTLSTQKKLLRVLQEREFERVGGTTTVRIDTRVVAATNKSLAEEIEAGRFREDLFYRLNVIAIHLPPLRERHGDVPLLVEHFLDKHRASATAGPSRISPAALRMLEEYSWPGNVRQLENVVERATVLARGGVITEEQIHLSDADNPRWIDIPAAVRRRDGLERLLVETERAAFREALAQADDDHTVAAALLDLPPKDFAKRLHRLDD